MSFLELMHANHQQIQNQDYPFMWLLIPFKK